MKNVHRFAYITVLTVCVSSFFLSPMVVSAQETFVWKADDEGGWLGVSIQDLTTALKEAMDYDRDVGVLVNDVEEDSPAEEAGIHEGDILVEYDGKAISSTGSLIRKVRATDPGDNVQIVVVRKGREVTVTATIAKKPTGPKYSFEHGKKGEPYLLQLKKKTGGWLGIHLQDLTEQLGEYFGVADGEGTLVTEVIADGPAEKAGLQAGDVIVSFNGEDVADVDELVEAVRESEVGGEVEIEVMRNKSKRTIRAEIGETPQKYKKPMIDIFGLPGYGGQCDIRWFDGFRKQWEEYDEEEPEDTIWRHRIHRGVEKDDLKELKKHIKKLEREIEKIKDRL